MTSAIAMKLQQSPIGAALSACWKLEAERALKLQPDQPSVFRVCQGQAWVTLDGPHHGPANDWGDVVLHAGEQLTLLRGQQVVVEAFGAAVNEPVFFSWEPVAIAPPAPGSHWTAWSDSLLRRLPDLKSRLPRAAAALRRGLAAVTGAARYLVAGDGRVLRGLEANQP